MRFPIKYDRLGRAVMPLALCFPSQSWIDVEAATVHVQLGWAFRAEFDVADVESVDRRPDTWLNRGAHGWFGTWLVNGASGPIVAIRLSRRRRAWVVGFPIRLRELRVSVDDPDAFIAALTSCSPTEGSARIS